MTSLLEAPKAEKQHGKRRSPQRYTPRIVFASPPARPARLPGGGVVLVLTAEMEARRQFFQSLPKHTERVIGTTERYQELEQLAALRRHFRYGVAVDIGDTLTRLQAIRRGLVEAFAGSLANLLWRLEGIREFKQEPRRWPNLNRSQLWAAGLVGLGNALDRGVVQHFHDLLYQCVLTACATANGLEAQGGRTIRPKKKRLTKAERQAKALADARAAVAFFTPVGDGAPRLNG